MEGSPIREAFQHIGALSFVDPGDVVEVWEDLRPTLPADLTDIVAYYERTWIGSAASVPLFSPWMWNHYESVMAALPRSSNIAEGWHNGFRSLMGASNPTIWRFLDVLKMEQDITDWKISQKMMRRAPPPQEPRWAEYDIELSRLINSYDDYDDKIDYLKCIGTLLAV